MLPAYGCRLLLGFILVPSVAATILARRRATLSQRAKQGAPVLQHGPGGGLPADSPIFRKIVEAVRDMDAAPDEVLTVAAAMRSVLSLVQGCDYVTITQLKGDKPPSSIHWTHETALQADQAQYDLHEGPCLDASKQDGILHSHNLPIERRWPCWTPRACDLGIGSVLAVPLATKRSRLGALNLYAARPDAFTQDDMEVGFRIAASIAVALVHAKTEEAAEAALQSRTVIGQAEGILMERFNLSPDAAFGVLVRLSQSENVKVRDIAADLVRTRRMDQEGRWDNPGQ